MTVLSENFNRDRLGAYLNEVFRRPRLSNEDEQAYARQWAYERDTSARDKIFYAHERMSASQALGYSGYGLPTSDMMQEGNSGLMKALNRFDPDRGARFNTYAGWWIGAEIKEYVLRNWSIVRLGSTADQKKLFFGLNAAKKILDIYEDQNLTDEDVVNLATQLGVHERDIRSMNAIRLGRDSSLNAQLSSDGTYTVEHIDYLKDESESFEDTLGMAQTDEKRKELLYDALQQLDDRARDILVRRRLTEPAEVLVDIAVEYRISKERVRQIENRALLKLRQNLESAMSENMEAEFNVVSEEEVKERLIGTRAKPKTEPAAKSVSPAPFQ